MPFFSSLRTVVAIIADGIKNFHGAVMPACSFCMKSCLFNIVRNRTIVKRSDLILDMLRKQMRSLELE